MPSFNIIFSVECLKCSAQETSLIKVFDWYAVFILFLFWLYLLCLIVLFVFFLSFQWVPVCLFDIIYKCFVRAPILPSLPSLLQCTKCMFFFHYVSVRLCFPCFCCFIVYGSFFICCEDSYRVFNV